MSIVPKSSIGKSLLWDFKNLTITFLSAFIWFLHAENICQFGMEFFFFHFFSCLVSSRNARILLVNYFPALSRPKNAAGVCKNVYFLQFAARHATVDLPYGKDFKGIGLSYVNLVKQASRPIAVAFVAQLLVGNLISYLEAKHFLRMQTKELKSYLQMTNDDAPESYWTSVAVVVVVDSNKWNFKKWLPIDFCSSIANSCRYRYTWFCFYCERNWEETHASD